MKNKITWKQFFLATLMVSFSSLALSQGQSSEMISGELQHYVADDFENQKHMDIFHIKDEKTKKVRELKFPNGKIPEKILHAPSGSKIKIRGKKSETTVTAEFSDSSSGSSYEFDVVTYPANAIKGTKNVLGVMVSFNDGSPACGNETTAAQKLLDPNNTYSVKNFMKKNSQGLVNIVGEMASVKINVNSSQVSNCSIDAVFSWLPLTRQALIAKGYNLDSYHHLMLFVPSNYSCPWSGLGSTPGDATWIRYCGEKVMNHELGHNFGYGHSSVEGSLNDYADGSCTMGVGVSEFNAALKHRAGWIPDEKKLDISASGTFKVSPLNQDSTVASYPQVYRIYDSARAVYYYLSYRENSGIYDKSLSATYSNRLNITIHKGSGTSSTKFLTAIAAGGGQTLPNGVVVKAISQSSSYIEFSVSGLSTSTPTTTDTTVPSVSLSSPLNGSTYTAGATVTASATASDNLAVVKVAFYVGGVLKYSDSTFPYGYSFLMPTSSSLSVYAIAYDAAGNLKKSAISYIKNPTTTTADTTVPSVTLSSPLNGATYAAGASVTASATASDNKAVAKVAFYVGGVLKSTDSTSPYNYSFSMPTSSSLSVYAIAYDAAGNLKKSAISYIKNPTATTADTTIPSVYLSSPVNGATYAAGASVTASATASDNKAVSKVLFYVGGVLKSTDTVAPYNYSFSMPTSSSLSVYAIAYDAAGNLKKSAISYIKNPTTTTTTTTADTIRPSVYLNTPAVGTKIAAGSTFTITATASDNKAVTKVSFYFNGKYCTDTTAPYSCSFLMPTGSNLMLRATAYDAANNYKYSNLVYVSN